MNSLLDDDDELDRNDREVTLSTGTILGIFFALVLICGLFFGFGYKMGSGKATRAELPSAVNAPSSAAAADFNGFKPAAGSPAAASAGADSSAGRSASIADQSGAASHVETSPATETSGNSARPSTVAAAARQTATERSGGSPAVAMTSSPPVAAGSFVVQVAAVSHEEDAQLLVNALRAKGYPVSAHTEPQDSFFHVQVGPFNSRKDADAAKQRLLADGYQPIIK